MCVHNTTETRGKFFSNQQIKEIPNFDDYCDWKERKEATSLDDKKVVDPFLSRCSVDVGILQLLS